MIKIRNYSNEHKKRQINNRRLLVDMNRDKAERFLAALKNKNLTFAKWINNQIDKEMGE